MITTPLRQRVILALIGSAVIGMLLAVAVRIGAGGFDPGYSLTATFDRVLQGLTVDRSDVKIRGITVGRVKGIELQDDGKVAVELFMQPEAKVPDTTVAAIEPLSVFGPKFLRLDPGKHETSGPFLTEGDEIARAERPVDFLDFISHGARLLEVADPKEIFTIVHTLAEGLDGLGPELGSIVDASETIGRRAVAQSPNLRALLGNVARLGDTLADRGDEIVGTARDLNGVLGEIASRPDELGELLDQTARVSAVLGDILEANPEAVDRTIVGISNLADVIARDIPGVVGLIQALDGFFGTLGRTVQLEFRERPDVQIGTLQTWASTDPCNIIAGLPCGGQGSPSAARSAASPRSASSTERLPPELWPLLKLLLPVPVDSLAAWENQLE